MTPAGRGRAGVPQENCSGGNRNTVKQLIEAGVHFGYRSSRWNPKMRPYIYGRRG